MNKKITSILIISLLIFPLFAFLVPVQGVSDQIVAYIPYTSCDYYWYLGNNYPSSDTTVSGWAETFKPSINCYASNLQVELLRISAGTTAVLRAYIVNVTSQSLNSSPNMAQILATASTVTPTNVGTWAGGQFSVYTFTFSGTNRIYLESSKYYAWVIVVESSSGLSFSDNVETRWNNGGSAGDGYSSEYYSSAWTSPTVKDIGYFLAAYASDPSATATPTSTAPAWANFWDSLAPFGTTFLVLIILMGCAIIGGRFGGVWGFLAGLNVAVIAVYITLGTSYMPLWGVIIMGVVDAGILVIGTQGIGRKRGD